jgi:hypothetical protein
MNPDLRPGSFKRDAHSFGFDATKNIGMRAGTTTPSVSPKPYRFTVDPEALLRNIEYAVYIKQCTTCKAQMTKTASAQQ